jgi:hypothetical protein
MSGFITPVVALAAIVAALLAERLGELDRLMANCRPCPSLPCQAAQEPQSERGSEWRRWCDLTENLDARGGAARRRLHLREAGLVVVGADWPPVLAPPPDLDEAGEDNGSATPACRAVPVRPAAGSGEVEMRIR